MICLIQIKLLSPDWNLYIMLQKLITLYEIMIKCFQWLICQLFNANKLSMNRKRWIGGNVGLQVYFFCDFLHDCNTGKGTKVLR